MNKLSVNDTKLSVTAATQPGETMHVAPKSKVKPVLVYRLKVYPQGQGHNIYRTIDICGNYTLAKLCETILDAFDFDREHMYEFCMDNKMYSDYSYQSHPEYGQRSVKVSLNQLQLVKGQKFSLHYDFGDDWMFVLRVESISEDEQKTAPKVIKSKGELEQYYTEDDDYEDDEF